VSEDGVEHYNECPRFTLFEVVVIDSVIVKSLLERALIKRLEPCLLKTKDVEGGEEGLNVRKDVRLTSGVWGSFVNCSPGEGVGVVGGNIAKGEGDA
jgi:hypothetical protein